MARSKRRSLITQAQEGAGELRWQMQNGDGKADIVLVSGSHAGTLLGNGGGTFQPVQISDLGMGPLFMATADVNKDGRADLLLMDTNAWVSLANVDGTFQAALATHAGAVDPAAIAGVDANGDGNPDILFLDSCRNVYACYATGGMLVVQLGNGDGTFQARVVYRTEGFFPTAMAVTDVNADGLPDVLVAQCTHSLRLCLGAHDIERGAGRVKVLEGDGNGGFHPVLRFSSGGIGESGEIAAGDITGDGRPDVVVTWGAFGVLIHTGRYPTSETLSSSLNPSVGGQPVTFTATVTSGLGPPTGFVRFMNGVHCLGKVTLIDGVATLTTDKLPVGTLPIIALYEPDTFWAKTVATLTQVVNPPSGRN